jgi:uncharacterized membrane protein YczE
MREVPSRMGAAVRTFFTTPGNRRRLGRCVTGLVLCGIGFALLVQADLGLDPWDVFHQGVSDRTGLPIGTVAILTGFVLLLVWIPLKERPGVGTILNALLIGSVMDLALPRLPDPAGTVGRWTMLLTGIAIAGVGIGLYIGAGLGPGPRDGIMTGLARRGATVRLARTGIELSALAAGWALGGTVGIGTVVFALAIGPVVQVTLELLSLPPRGEPLPRRWSRVRGWARVRGRSAAPAADPAR